MKLLIFVFWVFFLKVAIANKEQTDPVKISLKDCLACRFYFSTFLLAIFFSLVFVVNKIKTKYGFIESWKYWDVNKGKMKYGINWSVEIF